MNKKPFLHLLLAACLIALGSNVTLSCDRGTSSKGATSCDGKNAVRAVAWFCPVLFCVPKALNCFLERRVTKSRGYYKSGRVKSICFQEHGPTLKSWLSGLAYSAVSAFCLYKCAR